MMDVNGTIPLVSVIMPAYNAQEYIEEAIRSVQQQTVTDWELLVLDDGSQDETAAIVERLACKDPRIRFLPNDHNMGTARTRNRGLDLSRGQYVAFLDSDDVWLPTKIEQQINALVSEDADMVYTSYSIVGNDGVPCCDDFLVLDKVSLEDMLRRNEIGCSTVLLSQRAQQRYRFPVDFYHEDYALWLKMLRDGAVAVGVTDILVRYRFHANSRASNKLRSAIRRWHIYRDLLKMPLLQGGWYLVQYIFYGIKKYRRR